MFGALLILAASTLFLVKHSTEGFRSSFAKRSTPENTEAETATEDPFFILYALWSGSISVAVVILEMTLIAILNRSLDKPKTLLVNSRWVRLAPRIPAIIIIVCLPLLDGLTGSSWCGSVIVILCHVFFWEWIAGLEKYWKFLEPKQE